MAGIDENVAVIGEWPPLNPSPRTLFSSILGDDFGSRSFSAPQLDIESKEPLQEPEKQKLAAEPGGEDGVGDEISCNLVSGSSAFSSQRSGSRGSLAERMAARAGFNAPKLNTTRIRSSNMLSSTSPEVRSPYLTIPPGLSPTTLLDSPVFLSNSLAQYSPTTGKFSFGQSDNKSSILVPEVSDKNKDHLFQDIDTSSFMFKPHMESNVSYYLGTSDKVTSAPRNHQTLPSIDGSVQSAHPIMDQNLEVGRACSQNQHEYRPQADFSDTSVGNNTVCGIKSEVKASDDIVGSADHSSPPDDQEDGEGDLKGEHISSLAANAPSDDGYNWRKYGQKQVKGSEFPRSYYKCTHPNCQVKKKVERSHEGHITEIIYKGAHNHHPKPSPNRRVANGSSHPLTNIDTAEQPGPRTGFSGEPAWTGTQQGSAMAGPDRRHGGMETASSASVPTDCNPSAPVATQNGSRFDSSDPVDISSTLSNDDEDDDRGTHGSISLGYDEDGDESESKRRKVDASVMEISGATRAIREPRVVVQTTSEVDILDDGYRWRKYGQKVVKGNPNPRSYYKCTNAGCTVRKHVERASHDLKSVITTYEGKHNHDVPAARNSSHINSGTSGAAPQPAPRVTRPEPSPQFHDGMARFDGPTSLGTFVLPGRPPMGPMPSFTFGINQSSLANIAMASLGPGQAKLPNMPIHPFLGQHKLNEAGFVMPKGEPKEEPMSESGLPISNGAAFHQLMSRLPLGPHL